MIKGVFLLAVLSWAVMILLLPCSVLADCKTCYSLEEALQSKEPVERLVLMGRVQPSLAGLEELQSLQFLHINLEGMSYFPDETLALQNLEQLVIEGNPQLSVDDIARKLQVLPKLNWLYFRRFDCPIIPASILQLTGLGQLGISNSGVREVPAGIANLSNLYYLDLAGNEISSLPEEIGQLRNLNVLNIQYNKMETLPEVVEQIKNIWFVQITGNPLTAEAKGQLQTSQVPYQYIENDTGSIQWLTPEEPDNSEEQK